MADETPGSESDRSRRPLWHRHSSAHTPVDQYDHAIGLVDTTARIISREPAPGDEDESTDPAVLERRRTRLKAGVKRRQNDWAYRKYQKERVGNEDEQADSAEQSDSGKAGSNRASTYGTSTIRRKYGEMRDRMPIGQQKQHREHARKLKQFEIDILYENQRGAFFCGIPLYSHNSLLNFDPAAWQTSDFKESPVNITNAQLPDPTWTWAWKTWYVDMSHDVDEEGWEYSFSFRQGFAWHGTHPWFHSFVRRRRWLRKRVKVDPKSQANTRNSMLDAHKLNLDYFTIHSAPRESSTNRDPGSAAGTSQRYSAVLAKKHESDDDDQDEDISNMPALLAALKKAGHDRKKLRVVKAFIANGGQELHYLADRIPEILEQFVYQTSRRDVLSELQQAAARHGIPGELHDDESDSKGKDHALGESDDDNKEDIPGIRDALDKAIQAAHDQVQDYEYWSDLKATVKDAEDLDVPPPPEAGADLAKPVGQPTPPRDESHEPPGSVIKGIPQSAGVGKDVGIARRVTLQMEEDGKSKGKGKAEE